LTIKNLAVTLNLTVLQFQFVYFHVMQFSPSFSGLAVSGPVLVHGQVTIIFVVSVRLLWSPYGIGQTIIFSCCGLFMVALWNRETIYTFMLWFVLSSFFFLLSFSSSPNLSGRRLDVYHTLAHGVALVRI